MPHVPRSWLQYWKPNEIIDARSAGLLHHIASEQLGRVDPGDTVWIVSTRPPAHLIALGPIRVNKVISRATARRLLPYEPWDSQFHIVIPPTRAERAVDVPIDTIAARLRFESNTAPRLDLNVKGRGVAMQLQQIRRLTPASAALLARTWRSGVKHSEAAYSRASAAADQFTAGDKRRQVLTRTEQQALRQLVLGSSPTGKCAICGATFPTPLLVAAHIKPRARCTRLEKRDWLNNVVPMCLLGCDALFEKGLVIVRQGRIVTTHALRGTGRLGRLLDDLHGSDCRYWRNPGTRPYFAWHAAHAGSR
jgi:hypothetical protein